MRLTASDLYTYYRPSMCNLRVYLRERGEKESPPGPYEEVIRILGIRHEKAHLASFPFYVDLSEGTEEQRQLRTRKEVEKGTQVIYQPLLKASKLLYGIEYEILGEPDFLILDKGGYVVRDSKISRRITEKDHPEIIQQLEIYGWLYEQTFGHQPVGLQVHSGTGEIVEIPYNAGATALDTICEILAIKQSDLEPYSPVGWTKCGRCGFYDRCWPRAKEKCDVALAAGVDQGLAIALHNEGVESVDEFLSKFDQKRLADFQRPWGKSTQRVGKRAEYILRMSRSMATGKEHLLKLPPIPDHPNYVMFDLEGLPPQLDELEKIYLWGFQVFGEKPSDYQAATAGVGKDGDRKGWEEFLSNAKIVFKEYGDLPFVHWHHYERVRLDMYVNRFGDLDSVAAQVQQNLLDLLPITQSSIALPLPSYSLKTVEQYIGFKRTQDEYGGEWAMAKYIEATETEDENIRKEILEQILSYNREDLEATWAVLKWLKEKMNLTKK